MVAYSGSGSISDSNYANAFYSVDKFASVRNIILNMPYSSSSNTYTYAVNGNNLTLTSIEDGEVHSYTRSAS